jgi:hypothetical protein
MSWRARYALSRAASAATIAGRAAVGDAIDPSTAPVVSVPP